MQVTTVSAAVRFSKDTGAGWKVIELGAEASIAPDEDWHICQQGLFANLAAQLKAVWGSKGEPSIEHAPNGSEKAIQPSQEERVPGGSGTPPPQHFCQEHSTQFRKFERDGQVWWSHKAPDGQWCREKCP
jgi:hypothetical protein